MARDRPGRGPEDDLEPEIDDLAIQAGRMTEHYTRQRLRLEWQEQQAAAHPEERPETARREAEELCAILRRHSPEDRRILIEDAQEYRSWAVCEHLAEMSADLAAGEPGECGALAQLAVFVAGKIDAVLPPERPRFPSQGAANRGDRCGKLQELCNQGSKRDEPGSDRRGEV